MAGSLRALKTMVAIFFLLSAGLQAGTVLVTGQARTGWMRDTLTSHFSQPRHHVTNPQYKMAARQFIQQQFRDMGLTVVDQTFNSDEDGAQGVNVIGVMEGVNFNTAKDSVVAIGAHYDTAMNTPGVNDNGAAVVIMLETARQLAAKKPRSSTLLFIAFDFEETARGKKPDGSHALVTQWLPSYFRNWPDVWKVLVNMDVVLNFDDTKNAQNFPTGLDQLFPDQVDSVNKDQKEGDFLMMAGRTPEDKNFLEDLKATWQRQGHPDFEVEVFPIPANFMFLARDFRRSDHAPFWDNNLPAVFLSDTSNFRGYMQQCLHMACDDMTYVTDERLQFAAKISSTLVNWADRTAPFAA